MGRVGRLDYWLRLLAIVLLVSVLDYFYSDRPSLGAIVGVGLVSAVVPRLHDLGLKGWWMLIPMTVAMAGFWLRAEMPVVATILAGLFATVIFVLGIIPQQPGVNRYGQPLPRKLRYPN